MIIIISITIGEVGGRGGSHREFTKGGLVKGGLAIIIIIIII